MIFNRFAKCGFSGGGEPLPLRLKKWQGRHIMASLQYGLRIQWKLLALFAEQIEDLNGIYNHIRLTGDGQSGGHVGGQDNLLDVAIQLCGNFPGIGS